MNRIHWNSSSLLPSLSALLGFVFIAVALGAEVLGLATEGRFGAKQALLLWAGLMLVLAGAMRGAHPAIQKRLPEMATRHRQGLLTVLGGANLTSLVWYTVISHGMAPVAPLGVVQAHNAPFFGRLIETVEFLGNEVQAFVAGNSPLSEPVVFLFSYLLPVVISSGVFVTLLIFLAGQRTTLTAGTPRYLYRWAIGFGLVSALAAPVLVHDFWYPLAWGRMVATGVNPYYFDLTLDFTRGLPLNESHERMMYGPLLAAVSGAVMWLARGDALLGAVLFKILLVASWIGSVRLIWSLLRGQSVWHQCVGIATFGWLPLGVMQVVADGHNDIFMVFFMLLWLSCLQKGRVIAASAALAASVLVKYVTLPLFLVDVLHHRYGLGRSFPSYTPRVMVAAGLSLLVLGAFYRSSDFFAPVFPRTSWHFYSPREAILALQLLSGITTDGFLVVAARALFPAAALYTLAQYVCSPTPERLHMAVLAVLAAMLFGYITGLWPWYMVWVLAGAALVPGSLLSRWVQGVALAAPFPLLMLVTFPGINHMYSFDIPTLVVYVFPLFWFLGMPGSLFPAREPSQAASREQIGLQSG